MGLAFEPITSRLDVFDLEGKEHMLGRFDETNERTYTL